MGFIEEEMRKMGKERGKRRVEENEERGRCRGSEKGK